MKNEKESLSDLLKNDDSTYCSYGSVEEILAKHQLCPICGSNMHFKHLTDFAQNTTREVAKCPECKYQARDIVHKLQ